MTKEDQNHMHGSIKMTINNIPKIKLVFDKRRIMIDVLSLSEIIHQNNNLRLSRLKDIKKFATALAENGLTVSIFRNGIELVILGKEAKSKISKYITMNKYIEIRNLRELRRLDKAFHRLD